MSELIVVTFDSPEQAQAAREAIKRIQRDGMIIVEDAAVVSKDADGKLHMKNEGERSVGIGAGVGSMVGLLFSFALPGLGLAIGAAGGALIAKLLDRGVEKQFVKDTAEQLQPGESAIFLVVNQYSPAAIREVFEPYSGQISQTTLDPDLAEQLRKSLK
ncbi:MAG: DUF1269 domain-containing protein [Chloroflexales bacterium]|nr:DUF1269 domain-containing protein [Chloroflexales bacterium]